VPKGAVHPDDGTSGHPEIQKNRAVYCRDGYSSSQKKTYRRVLDTELSRNLEKLAAPSMTTPASGRAATWCRIWSISRIVVHPPMTGRCSFLWQKAAKTLAARFICAKGALAIAWKGAFAHGLSIKSECSGHLPVSANACPASYLNLFESEAHFST
jgi:hypothetical protein